MSDYCQLILACRDEAEASAIARALLDQKLIACSRQIATKSQFIWKGEVEKADDVILVMESREDLFDEIEKIITKLHSYDTPVLTATPITKISKKAQKWLNNTLKLRRI